MQPEAPVRVELSRAGLIASEILPAVAVARTVRDLEGERDVTVTISPVGGSAHLLIAVDGSAAFLGLERADGVFQFATRGAGPAETTEMVMIGGQQTDVESHYLLGVQEATTAIQDWLDDEESSVGFWERR